MINKLIIPKINNYEFLKLTALLTMLIDHTGYIFFPEYEFLRWIGRLALPLFMYQYIIGFEKTSNQLKSLRNIWVFFLISQIPFTLMLNIYQYSDSLNVTLNIFFPLALGYTILYIWVHLKKHILLKIFILIILFTITFFVPMDYSWFVPITLFLMYFLKDKFYLQLLIFAVITLFTIQINLFSNYQAIAIIGLALAPILYKVKMNFIIHKYFHYMFYPIHILILVSIYYFII